ncbi:putative metalloprotease with PDZ domain [Streptomyces sp. 3330]|uniref:hypothetical protein n=1 Tax=Streptomyces sp. 3330 TaxID=2817755 RepID=UPI002862610B|nr:hypothetical protein [Streptomyces sp. 3330]MDR6976509.1 putative metalloprotease with PDZ domain [Streptomyces sp. 3330]
MPHEQCQAAKAKLEHAKQRKKGLQRDLTEDEAKLAHLKAQSPPDTAAIEAQERMVEIDRRVLGAAEVEVTGFEELVHALCDDLP